MVPLMNPTDIQLRDESGMRGTAEGILNPTNEAAAQEMIRDYKDRGITFQGTRTGICGGSVPDGGVIIGTAWMKWVWDRQEDGDDILAHVGAGITLDQLDTALSREYEGYIWPPRPLEETATVGGIVATAAKGINAVYYGETRKYIEAVKLIDNEGQHHVITDPEQLDQIVGSEGKRGLITDVTVRLVPKPQAAWGVALFFDDEIQAAKCAQEMKVSLANNQTIALMANEFLDEASLKLIDECRDIIEELESVPAFPDGAKAMVFVEMAGNQSQMMPSLMPIIGVAGKYGCDPSRSWVQMNEAGVGQLRAVRKAVVQAINTHISKERDHFECITKLSVDIARPNADLADVLANYRADLDNAKVRGVIFGHVYNNNLHVNLLPTNEAEYEEGVQLMKKWVAAGVEDGAQVFKEHGMGRIKSMFMK